MPNLFNSLEAPKKSFDSEWLCAAHVSILHAKCTITSADWSLPHPPSFSPRQQNTIWDRDELLVSLR